MAEQSGSAPVALTPETVANLAAAAGLEIAPERLPAVLTVLEELFALEREIRAVEIAGVGGEGQA